MLMQSLQRKARKFAMQKGEKMDGGGGITETIGYRWEIEEYANPDKVILF